MMKVAIGGSFSIYNKMIKLANELKAMGIEVTLPKHFQGLTDPSKIEKLKKRRKKRKTKTIPTRLHKNWKSRNMVPPTNRKCRLPHNPNRSHKRRQTNKRIHRHKHRNRHSIRTSKKKRSNTNTPTKRLRHPRPIPLHLKT